MKERLALSYVWKHLLIKTAIDDLKAKDCFKRAKESLEDETSRSV